MSNFTQNNEKFYDLYHASHPDNIKYINIFLNQDFGKHKENVHYKAMLHFLEQLQENEQGFIYGMLCEAWKQFILSIQ